MLVENRINKGIKYIGGSTLSSAQLEEYIQRVRDALSGEEPEKILVSVYREILNVAFKITDAKEGAVLVVDSELKNLRIEVWKGPGVDDEVHIIEMNPEKSVCAWAVVNRQPALVPDVDKDKRFKKISSSKINSELAVPVFSRGVPIGVVNLESFDKDYFIQEHVDHMREFCDAISNYWELARLIDWGARIALQNEWLGRVNQSLLRKDSDTLDIIRRGLFKLMDSDIADILLLDEEGENLIVHATEDLKDSEEEKIPRGEGIVWRCIKNRKVEFIQDTKDEQEYLHITKEKMKSMIAVPLVHDGDPIGVINVESKKINHFSLEDELLLKLFADQATIAVINAGLLDQNLALQSLASLGNLTGNLTHRMNNIVGGIRVLSRFLANDLQDQFPELAEQALQIEETATDALDVVDDYEKKFRISTEEFDLIQLIGQLRNEISHPAGVEIVLHLPKTAMKITSSRLQMTEIIRELIRNALKSVKDTGVIEIGVKETPNAIEIIVSDDGEGIAEEHRSRIFERGFRARESALGMGFGLWFVANFVGSYGGKVDCDDRDGGGATFRIVIPKNKLKFRSE